MEDSDSARSGEKKSKDKIRNNKEDDVFDPLVEKKLKDHIEEQTIEDYKFLEDLARLIHEREEEKTHQLEQYQFQLQKVMRGSMSKRERIEPKIEIGKFGML